MTNQEVYYTKETAEGLRSLCQRIAKRYKHPADYEDLVSVGFLAAWECLEHHESATEPHIRQVASRAIHDYLNITKAPVSVPVSDTARKVARGSGNLTGNYSEDALRDMEAALKGEVSGLVEDAAFEPDHALAYEEWEARKKIVDVATETLTLKELKLFYDRFVKGKSKDEIVEEIGYSRQTLTRWEDDIIRKIRKALR